LVRAGVVRTDVSSDWVNFATFGSGSDGLATAADAHDLLPAMDMPSDHRYFACYWERNFFTLSARPKPLG
jgi:hypothetical protein